jgi:hypothetical protein
LLACQHQDKRSFSCAYRIMWRHIAKVMTSYSNIWRHNSSRLLAPTMSPTGLFRNENKDLRHLNTSGTEIG